MVFWSGSRDMSTHDSKQPGQCPGMPGPAGTYVLDYKAESHTHRLQGNRLYAMTDRVRGCFTPIYKGLSLCWKPCKAVKISNQIENTYV